MNLVSLIIGVRWTLGNGIGIYLAIKDDEKTGYLSEATISEAELIEAEYVLDPIREAISLLSEESGVPLPDVIAMVENYENLESNWSSPDAFEMDVEIEVEQWEKLLLLVANTVMRTPLPTARVIKE